MSKILNLQDTFLNQARKERIPVTTYLVNGFQCKGIVKGFDNYVVIFDCQGQQQLVYKHAISTIAPARPVSILENETEKSLKGARAAALAGDADASEDDAPLRDA